MKTIHIIVPGDPVPAPRQRHRVAFANGKAFSRNFVDGKHPVRGFKELLKILAADEYADPPWCGPVVMRVAMMFARPKGMVWKRKPMPRIPKTSKPDNDNLMKSIKDALQGIVYVDDSQVFDEQSRKFTASGNEQPRTVLTLWLLEPDECDCDLSFDLAAALPNNGTISSNRG